MEEYLKKNKLLYNILFIIFKKKIFLIVFWFMCFILIMFFTFLKTPVYKATTKILIRKHPQQQLILFRDLATPGEESAGVNPAFNLIQILSSQEMAMAVVEKFGLDERLREKKKEPKALRDQIKKFLLQIITYPFKVAQNLGLLKKKEENFFADAVKDFMKDAEDIKLEESTDVINLTILENTPRLSTDIANFMAHRLIKKSKEIDQHTAKIAHEFTAEQISLAKNNLHRSEDELVSFKKKENIIDLEKERKFKLEELDKLESQLIEVKVELSEVKSKLEKMREQISIQKKRMKDTTIVANNPAIATLKSTLKELEVNLAANLIKYKDSSIVVQGLRAQTQMVRDKIAEELEQITEDDISTLYSIHADLPNEYFQLIIDVSALEISKKTLEEEIKKLKDTTFSLTLNEIALTRIMRNISSNEKIYTKLLDKLSELEVQKSSEITGYDLKIIDEAFVPEDQNPNSPKWILVLPLGFICSLLLSFSAIFLIEYWDESFKAPDEIEDRLGIPVLCTVTNIKR